MIDLEIDRHRRCLNIWKLEDKRKEGEIKWPRWRITFEKLEELLEVWEIAGSVKNVHGIIVIAREKK